MKDSMKAVKLPPYSNNPTCPKCHSSNLLMRYERGGGANANGERISESLCLRCQTCGYGWSTQTADSVKGKKARGRLTIADFLKKGETNG